MGKKGSKRKTRWRVLPIGGEDGCNGVCSNNEDEVDGDRDSVSPLNTATATSSGKSYARASTQRMPRTKPGSTSSRGGNYNYRHRPYYQQPHENSQPLVTTEKKMFNEEEYTKITTPRQDVLFKKGYLGRKRSTAAPSADTTASVNNSNTNPSNTAIVVANGNLNLEGTADHNGETVDNEHNTRSDVMSPVEEQPQYIYATNGYVDQTGGPPAGLYYINGSGYELYDPYSGNVTVVVGPAPHYGGPGGGPPVLAAVPCQPLPLQPLEWFNPAFLPYVTAPCHNGLATARERRKRDSTDSQNCSPQSSESADPPGSPQECEMELTQPGEPPEQAMYAQPPAYVYPGYMFGPPMYNVNGVTVQGAPTQPPSCDITGSNKRRKKKRRRRRRRGVTEDGCSEESSSDEKELEEPTSVTSQESSSQEIESDSKQSTTITTLNDSSSSSPLSSCQTLTPTDLTNTTVRLSTIASASAQHITELKAFDSETSLTQTQSPNHIQHSPVVDNIPSLKNNTKDTYFENDKCNVKPLVEQSIQQISQVEKDLSEDSEILYSVQPLKDQTNNSTLDLNSPLCTSAKHNSLEKGEELLSTNCPNSACVSTTYQSAVNGTSHFACEAQNLSNSVNLTTSTVVDSLDLHSLNLTESPAVQCNGIAISGVTNANNIKSEDAVKSSKQKKSGKQSNVKSKKNSKGKEDKQKKVKTPVTNCGTDTDQKKINKKKDENKKDFQAHNGVTTGCGLVKLQQTNSTNSIPLENITENVKQCNSESFSEKSDIENDHEIVVDHCKISLNGFREIGSSNAESKSKIVNMDGNEKMIKQHQYSDESAEASGVSCSSSSTKKHDLFPEFGISQEPPLRPIRKEKQKTPLRSSQPPDKNPCDVSTKAVITDKAFELPSISLRPEIPKTDTKVPCDVTLAKQLKDTTDILESITVALISEQPDVKRITHQETPLKEESGLNLNIKEKLEEEMMSETAQVFLQDKTATDIFQSSHEDLRSVVSTSYQEENDGSIEDKVVEQKEVLTYPRGEIYDNFPPPIPPPRSKKSHGISKEHFSATCQDGKQTLQTNVEGGIDESSGESTSSSTTHESEESVIELLSSMHTNPDDREKDDFSDDDEDDIIFRGKKFQENSKVINANLVPPDKTDNFTPSISGPALQNSSQFKCQNETTIRDVKLLDIQSHANVMHTSIACTELYADVLSKMIISEAIHESSKKRTSLPITEAVTRWLRSQSPEVLSLAPPEYEQESDVSSEEQETEDGAKETDETEQELTGQKNVYCNPLLVPLPENCNHLLVNSDVNNSGYNNGTSRRVAFNNIDCFKNEIEDTTLIKNSDNGITSAVPAITKDNSLSLEHESCELPPIDNCVITTPNTVTDNMNYENEQEHEMQVKRKCVQNVCLNEGICDGNCNCHHIKNSRDTLNNITDGMKKEGNGEIFNAFENVDKLSPNTTRISVSDNQRKQNGKINIFSKKKSEIRNDNKVATEDDEFSFTSEETPECEWDLWDCNPVKPPSAFTVSKNLSPNEEVLAKTPDDYCSHMCDPAVSVAKYYSLGAQQEENPMPQKPDEDEILSYLADSSDEEVDALKHFQHEFEDDDGLKTFISSVSPNVNVNSPNSNCRNLCDEDKSYGTKYGNTEIYKSHYGEACCRNVSSIDVDSNNSRNLYNMTLSQRAQTANLFHRKSSIIVSKLKGDAPFPCGGICCILQ